MTILIPDLGLAYFLLPIMNISIKYQIFLKNQKESNNTYPLCEFWVRISFSF